LKWLWHSNNYWALWFWGLLATFLVRESWAIKSKRIEDTFSFWVWEHLKIHSGEGIGQWTAVDFLTFGLYVVLFSWLTFHFWWHKFV
jgi:hypothetical protein